MTDWAICPEGWEVDGLQTLPSSDEQAAGSFGANQKQTPPFGRSNRALEGGESLTAALDR